MAEQIGLYPVKLLVEHRGALGAPALTLNLLVDAPTGRVVGLAQITQSLPPPYGEITIPQVTGQILHTGFGHDTLLVHVSGEYTVSVPPPAIGTYLAQFSAALAVDKGWEGKGTFTYGSHTVTDATVTNESATAPAKVSEPA